MAEIPLALLESLAASACAPGRIAAADFQRTLKQHGLAFGEPIVDALMLRCRIDASGLIDFSAAEAAASDTRFPYGNSASTAPETAPQANFHPPPQSAAFRDALEKSAGVPASPARPSDGLSQMQRVRAHTKELSALLGDLELGRISVDVLSAALRDLGIAETPEATRLLRQLPVSFAALYRALQTDSAAPASGEIVPLRCFAPGTRLCSGSADCFIIAFFFCRCFGCGCRCSLSRCRCAAGISRV
jgi:hypothetical protein